MEKQLFEQTAPVEISENTNVEKKEEQTGQVSLGKFRDAETLLSAYNSLQSEFTKRCQRVKELEGMLNSFDKTQQSAVPKEEATGENTVATKIISEEEREEILKDYLKGVASKKQSAIILDGVGAGLKTLAKKPKTFAEAGEIVKEMFKN